MWPLGEYQGHEVMTSIQTVITFKFNFKAKYKKINKVLFYVRHKRLQVVVKA